MEFQGGARKNGVEFQGGMTSENGYPQQGGYEKFLEKPNTGNCWDKEKIEVNCPLFLHNFSSTILIEEKITN